MVIDTPDCAHSRALALACPSCLLILCAPQEGDGPVEEEEPFYSRDAYHAQSGARVRKVAMQDVPSLEAHTLDFTLVRQLRIDTSVDQQAEIESVIGWPSSIVHAPALIHPRIHHGTTRQSQIFPPAMLPCVR